MQAQITALVAMLFIVGTGAVSETARTPAWAFPGGGSPPPPADPVALRSLPGSRVRYTDAQVRDLTHAVDWRPNDHPPLPAAVSIGERGNLACGSCHLPTGAGRPENASLAGLPADYIVRQVAAFADGSRRPASNGFLPAEAMVAGARSVSPKLVAEAAAYYSRLPHVIHVRVVEARAIPHAAFSGFIYALGGPPEPLGERIVEGTADIAEFELRDPDLRYTAYVPIGAIARGRQLSTTGGPAKQPCATCHGSGLRGAIGPPLAGRSPSGLFRALLAFREGRRADVEAAPMRAIAQDLTDRQMIALAAYAATLIH